MMMTMDPAPAFVCCSEKGAGDVLVVGGAQEQQHQQQQQHHHHHHHHLQNQQNQNQQNQNQQHERRTRLPIELLFHIVESLLPTKHAGALLPATHTSTKTLLALTRVSRALYPEASRLLRERCVVLDSSWRLSCYLACMARTACMVPAPSPSLRHITSLHLAPFGASLDDEPTATGVRELLCQVSGTLQRLVVQMPFGSLDALNDRHVGLRRTLRWGFEQLSRITDFICLDEYPVLSVPEAHTDVWRLWPELRRVALFGVPIDSHWLWWDIATLPHLEHVLLARPQHLAATNIKDEYFHKLPRGDRRLARRIRITLVDVAYQLKVDTARWSEIDPSGLMTVEAVEVPLPFYGDETPRELVTDWVRRRALAGTLWTWSGERVGN